MKHKTPDEKWVQDFVSRHPATRGRMSVGNAAKCVLHDAEALAPDRVERWAKAGTREYVIELIEAMQRGDRRKALRMLKVLPDDMALRLVQAIADISRREGA
jgi:hypothetical protein